MAKKAITAEKIIRNEYDQQAADFCEKYGVVIEKTFIRVVHGFPNEQDNLDHEKFEVSVYKKSNPDVRLETPFYNSFSDLEKYTAELEKYKSGIISKKPKHTLRDYDVLASIACETYCPSTIEEFIDEYGYEIKRGGDLARVQRIFYGCRKLHDDLHRVFNEEELEALAKIQ